MKLKFIHTILLLLVAAVFNLCAAQKNTEVLKPAKKLPEGTYFLNNQLKVMSGYVATLSADNKVVTISKRNGNGITGTFTCDCSKGSGSCAVTTTGSNISCQGGCECKLITTITGISGSFSVRQ